jgi:type IX secretion system PorP/SprF family membrane protein
MRSLLKNASLAVLACCAMQGAKAQDPHFTQYYVYPSWLNPALTGVFDGDYRVSGIYRSQWGNVAAFKTPGISMDINTNKNTSFGLNVLHQSAGNGSYNYTTAYGSMAYSGVRFGANESQRISLAIQAGMIQRGFNRSKLTFGDQWNPVTGYNPGSTSIESLTRTNAVSFDVGAGILYYDAQPGKKANLFAGFSASHLTRPEDQFSAEGDARLPMRYNAHAGVRLMVNDQFSLTPNLMYMRQGAAEEKMVGAYGQLKAGDDVDFMIGANYRFEDAISPFVGFYYKNMTLGASYDINTSDLGKLAKGSNSFEISLTFVGRRKPKTPEVEFICPRL